jgi:hypothetical protein
LVIDWFRDWFGGREGESGLAGFEGNAFGGRGGYADGPALGGDFDELTFGVGEVDEDFFGSGGDAAGVDAVGDADFAAVRLAGGLGFEVMEDGAEGLGGGDGVELGEALGEEALAEGAGADGEGVIAAVGLGGDLYECASVDAGEGGAALGDAEEALEGRGAAGFGWVTHEKDSPIRRIALGRA